MQPPSSTSTSAPRLDPVARRQIPAALARVGLSLFRRDLHEAFLNEEVTYTAFRTFVHDMFGTRILLNFLLASLWGEGQAPRGRTSAASTR